MKYIKSQPIIILEVRLHLPHHELIRYACCFTFSICTHTPITILLSCFIINYININIHTKAKKPPLALTLMQCKIFILFLPSSVLQDKDLTQI